MSIPTVIAANLTGGAIDLDRLGLTVPAGSTLTLSDYAYIDEMLADESLYSEINSGNIVLNYGSGNLTKGDSLKFFNIVTQEVRISVDLVEATANLDLTGSETIDGIGTATGDRVLATAQTDASENGVWVVDNTGAWARPEDYDTDQSGAGAMFYTQRGGSYAGTLWNCDTVTGSDVIDTDDLAFSQVSGGGGATTLQGAYDNGNTITTAAAADIAFTLTAGDFTVDDGTIAFGSGTALTAFTVDGGTTAFGGNTALTSFDVDTGTMSLDSTDTTNLTMSANAAAAKTLTIAATNANVGGTAVLDIDADDGITVDTGGTLVMQSTGASGWSNGSGNLALTTTSTGVIQLDGVDGVDLNSTAGPINIGDDADTGAINIGTGAAARTITLGNKTGTTSTTVEAGTGGITLDATTTTVTGDLVVQGTTTTVESEIVNIADNFLYLNDGYTTTSAHEGGIVVNYLPTATTDTVGGTAGFTAGSPGTANPTVSTTGGATFAAGDFIQISGAADQTNDGLYEVLSHAGNVLTIAGVGTAAATYRFTQNDFETDATIQGSITKVTVGAIQVDTGGDWQVGSASDSGSFTFTDLITSGTLSLQTAYDGGQTITTDASGPVVVAGTQSLQVTATGGLDVDTVADFDVTTFDVLMTGNNGFSIDGTADSNVAATNTQASTNIELDLTADNQGAVAGDALVDINATSTNGTGTVDIDADDAVAIDVLTGGTIDVGTDAVANTVTMGNTTGTTGVNINTGSEQVEINNVTYYGNSAGIPTATAAGFQEGDKYYDTTLDMEMRYDSTRGKWLSVEAMYIQYGRNGNTQTGTYYRGIDGRVMGTGVGANAAELGYIMPHDATVVASGYTRTDVDATTVEFHDDGVSLGSHSWLAATTEGTKTDLNLDIDATHVLALYNNGNTTSDVMAWVKVKFRIDVP